MTDSDFKAVVVGFVVAMVFATIRLAIGALRELMKG